MTTDSEAWLGMFRDAMRGILSQPPTPGAVRTTEFVTADAADCADADDGLRLYHEQQKRGDFGTPQRKPRPTIQDLEAILAAEDAAPVDAASFGAKVTAEFRRLERLAGDRLVIIERLTKERDDAQARAGAAASGVAHWKALADEQRTRADELTARVLRWEQRTAASEEEVAAQRVRAETAEREIGALKRARHDDAAHKSELAALADELRTRAEEADEGRSHVTLEVTIRTGRPAQGGEQRGNTLDIEQADHRAESALSRAKAQGYLPDGKVTT